MISHKDGQPIDPGPNEYFVLSLKKAREGHDPRSFTALRAYIIACMLTDYPQLAADLSRNLRIHIPPIDGIVDDAAIQFLDICLSMPIGTLSSLKELGPIGALGSRILNLRDTQEHLIEILGEIWALIYHGDTESWEYPGQILNHIRVELKEKNETIERLRHTIKQLKGEADEPSQAV